MRQLYLLIFILALHFPLRGEQNDLLTLRKELEQKKGTDSKKKSLELLNVSYDPTREFYENYNPLFAEWWKERTQQKIVFVQSHGGSGVQARAVISGLEADVVTLALAYDINMIEKFTHVVGSNWSQRLPNNSVPYYSTIVFLVRKGNPKQIYDWGDLTKSDLSIVTPNPKTSGGAAWTYISAWAWASLHFKNDREKMKEYMLKLYANVPILDSGARGATTTFIQRQSGDVLLTWENEAYLTKEKINHEDYEIIYPSISIKAEPSVAWLDTFIKEKGTEDLAKFYLKFLYSSKAQELVAKFHFRPYDEKILNLYRDKYRNIKLVSIEDFGGWNTVYEDHLKNEAIFDEIFMAGKLPK